MDAFILCNVSQSILEAHLAHLLILCQPVFLKGSSLNWVSSAGRGYLRDPPSTQNFNFLIFQGEFFSDVYGDETSPSLVIRLY